MSKFFDLSKKQPAVASTAPEAVSPTAALVPSQQEALVGQQLHLLPDWWTFWHHQRYTHNDWMSISKDYEKEKPKEDMEGEEEEEAGNGDKADEEGKDEEEKRKARFSALQNQYLQGTNPVSFPKYGTRDHEPTMVIDSVEQFWQCESNLKSVDKLPQGAELFFFRDGIKPMWEDPRNRKGGRWSFFFVASTHGEEREKALKRVGMVWERLLLKLACGAFIPDDNHYREIIEREICGAMLSIRGTKVIISIWNTHLEYEKYVSELMEEYRAETLRLRRELNADGEGEEDPGKGGEDGGEKNGGKRGGRPVSSDIASVVSNILHKSALPGGDEEEPRQAANSSADAILDADEEDRAEDVQKVLRSPNFTGLTPFMIRRGICDAMLRVVAEVDDVLKKGENPITAKVSDLRYRHLSVKSQYKRHFSHGKGKLEVYYGVPGEGGSNSGVGINGSGSYRGHNHRNGRENNNNGNSSNNNSNDNNSGPGNRDGNDGTFNFHRRRRYPRYNDSGANERENGGGRDSGAGEDLSAEKGQDSDQVFSFRRRRHYQPAVKNAGEDGETTAENDGFVVQGRRAGNFGRWRRKNGTSNSQRSENGTNLRNTDHRHTNNSSGSTANEASENGNQENSFASLGKQRKRLEIKEDGKLIGEVNMLSFGSRRRRLLQKQHTSGSRE